MFHVKPNKVTETKHITKALHALSLGKTASFKVDSPSLISFVLKDLGHPYVVVCDKGLFDDVYGSYDHGKDSAVAGFPFLEKEDLSNIAIHSYHRELFNRSSSLLSSNLRSVFPCVVDVRAYTSPLIYRPKERPLVVGTGDPSIDHVVNFLHKNKYKKVDCVSSPGDYVVRGGVLDVFSYDSSFPFRVGFLGGRGSVLFFNSSTGNIIKKTKTAHIVPLPQKRNLLLKDLDYFKYTFYYQGGFLFVSKKTPSFKNSFLCGTFSSFSYSQYQKNKNISVHAFSDYLISSGCFYNKVLYLPSWFSKNFSFKTNEEIPLSETYTLGDYFVHDFFGVCKYLGFAPREKDKNEKIVLAFSDGKLSLDVRFLNRISFFAPSGANPILDGLNKTGLWKRRKKVAQKQAEEFVVPLVKSYVQRTLSSGPAVRIEEDILNLFLSEFPYIDTKDQAAAWSSILKDFFKNEPMHRLLCGDVGFGKTEIAIRAAFVCCFNNLPVLVVAPTTVLCRQLYECFQQRLSSFGYNVACVSRLSSNNKKIMENYCKGNLSVLVSTHTALNNSSVLSSSGLIIIDEEHRFGVNHKEKIFKASPSCHFLSMSATPIPRTLQFSLSGIRNLSTLVSPPKARKPIITNIYQYNKDLIKRVIYKEVLRGGQVYIVDNSVNNVLFFYSFIKRVFNSFSVGVLYGSLSTKAINKTMSSFRLGKINILISTVIIESGIDIPSANTIIINNAHMFGLSQLHQLRGRVGRSPRQAYAFLFVPKKTQITPGGLARLDSIKQHSTLGSGYRLSLEDLEIRGSGSLFGYKQSGKNYIGFEHYSKMLYTAMQKIKNPNSIYVPADIAIDDAYIPSSFIILDGQRSFYYKSLSEINSLEDLSSFLLKTENLFGKLPGPFLSLFKSKKLSLLSASGPVSKITCKNFTYSVFCFVSDSLNISNLISSIGLFFKKLSIPYTFSVDKDFLKIEFKYIKDDYYILLENFITYLHD